MATEISQPAQDRWCDIDGNHVGLLSWIEQVAEHPEQGALFSGLHQQGEVIGRGPDVLYVRFKSKGQVISVSPRLVRLLPEKPDERWP
ncbi:MAG: hypothetical protein ACRDRA_18905 [Pseudonocardiaceae bacterium]